MANHKIQFDIGVNVQKQQLDTLSKQLEQISKKEIEQFKHIKLNVDASAIEKAKQAAGEAAKALKDAFNPELGVVNFSTFQKSLEGSNQTISQLGSNLAGAGAEGQNAFLDLRKQLSYVNLEFKETTSLGEQLGQTLWNTVKWSITSSALNSIVGAIQKAWRFAVRLDTSLNDIRIVTGKSAEEMAKFAKEANKSASALGASTTAYTKASLIYYQQGLDEKDVKARTEATVKAANVTGQSTAEVSEQLTAVWNGYKVASDEAELYVDKLAAVAASTASDLEELSEGMSKVASAANAMGVDIDQLTAQLSTIVSVTRQDASSVGTALKTIYARMGDLAVAGEDEFGTALGDVSGKLKQMGVDVLDQEGNLRDMGEVIEEVAGKWGGWTDAQQQAAAVALAGKRQYNNLIALFENWDMYEKALTTSQDAEGTLQEQQDTYMESIQAHLDQLATAGEKVYNALFSNTDGINRMIDGLTTFVDLVGTIVEGMGGLTSLLPIVLGLITKIMGQKMSNDLNKLFDNKKKQNRSTEILKLASQSRDDRIISSKYSTDQNVETERKNHIVDKQVPEVEKEKDKIRLEELNKEAETKELTKEEQEEKQTIEKRIEETSKKDFAYKVTTIAKRDAIKKDRDRLEKLEKKDKLTEKEEEEKQAIEKRIEERGGQEEEKKIIAEADSLDTDSFKKERSGYKKELSEIRRKKPGKVTEEDQQRKSELVNLLSGREADYQVEATEEEAQDTDIEKYQDLKLQYADSISKEEADALDSMQEQYTAQLELINAKKEELELSKQAQEAAEQQLETLEKSIKTQKESVEAAEADLKKVQDEKVAEGFSSRTSDGTYELSKEAKEERDSMLKLSSSADDIFGMDSESFGGGHLTEGDKVSWKGKEDDENLKGEVLKSIDTAKKGLGTEAEIKELESYRKMIEKGSISLEEYEKALELVKKGSKEKAAQISKAEKGIKNYNKTLKNAQTRLTKTKKELTALTDEEKKQQEAKKTAIDNQKKQNDAIAKAEGEIKKVDAAYADMEDSLNRKAKIQAVTDLVGGFTQLVGVVQAIMNLGNVWSDEDLSTGEKLVVTVTTLVTLLSTLSTIFGAVKALQTAMLPLTMAENAALKQKSIEELRAIALQKLGNEMTEDEIKTASRAVLISKLTAQTKKEETAAIKENTKEKIKNGIQAIKTGIQGFISGFMSLGPWGILLGIIILLTAAFVILFVILANQETAADKAKKKFEQANAALESYKKNLEAAKNANEELKKSIEDYKDAQKALEELQKGTKEWNEQLEANNQNVMDLMEKYPELAQYVSTNTDGVMQISEEGLDKIQENSEETVAKANAAVISQKMRTADAKAHWKRTEIIEDFQNRENERMAQGAALGAAAGSALSIFGPVAGIIGTVAGNVAGIVGAGIENAQIDDLTADRLDKIAEVYAGNRDLFSEDEESFKKALSEAGVGNQGLIDALWDNKSALEEATKAQVNATEQNKILEQQYAAAALADDELYKLSDNQDAFAKLAAQQKVKIEDSVSTKEYRDSDGDYKNGDSGAEALKNDYAAAMGVDVEDITVDGDTIKIKGEDGETQEIAREEAINTIRDYKAMESVDTGKIATAINAATQVSEGLSAVVAGEKSVALSGSLSDYEEVTGEETLKAIADELGVGVEEAANVLGYESAQAYQDAVDNSIKNMKTSFENIGNSLFGAAETAWNNFITTDLFKNMDNAQLNHIKDALETTFKTGGEEGVAQLQTLLNSYADDPETAAALAGIASEIDWSSMTATKEFRAAVTNAGLEFSDSAKAFAVGMAQFNNIAQSVMKNFDTVIEDLKLIKEVSEEISPGEIIDPEQFNKIKAINSEVSDLFIKTVDGYKYIGKSAQELNNILKQDSSSSLTSIKKDMQDLSDATSQYIEDIGGEEKITASLSVSGSADQLAIRASEMMQTMGANYSKMVGVNQGALEEAIALIQDPNADKSSTEYSEAKDLIKEALTQGKQTVLDYQAGLMESTQAEEVWATEYAKSLDEVNTAYEQGNISKETQEKARLVWLNKYTEELGISTEKWREYWDKAIEDGTKTQKDEEAALEKLRTNAAKKEIDRYKSVNNELNKRERALSKLEDKELSGAAALENSKKQRDLQSEILAQKQAYVALLSEENQEDRESFETIAATYDIAVDYDEQGYLSQTTRNALNEEYLTLVKEGKEEEAESVKALIEQGDKIDENVESAADLKEETQEILNNMQELAIEDFNLVLSLQLDASEAKRQYLDFKRNYIDKLTDNDFSKNLAYDYQSLLTYATGSLTSTISHIQDTNRFIREIQTGNYSENNIFAPVGEDSDSEEAIAEGISRARENRKEDLDTLVSEYESAYEYLTSMQEAYLGVLEKTQEAFDSQTEAFESMQSLLESNLSLTELLYGESSYSKMSKYYAAMNKNNQSNLKAQREALTFWSDKWNKMQSDLAQASVEERYNIMASEEYQTIQESYISATESWYSTLETTIQGVKDDYLNSINAIFETMNSELSSGMSMEYISEEWDLINQKSSKYFDEVNSAYQLQKLDYSMMQSIDGLNGNIKAQERLNKLRETELAALKEKDKLTQQDIERANKAYELELKRIALEEAQNTASSMKLTRDAQGNYSYAYVEDSDNVEKLKQEVAALENSLYNFDKDAAAAKYNEAYSTYQEYQSKLVAAAEAGDTQRMEMIKEQYIGAEGLLTTVLNEVREIDNVFGLEDSSMVKMINELANSPEKLQKSANEISTMTNNYQEEIEDLTSSMDSTMGKINDSLSQIISNSTEFKDAVVGEVEEIENMTEAIKSLEVVLDNLAKTINSLLASEADDAQKEANETSKRSITTIEENTKTIIDQLNNGFEAIANGEKYVSLDTGGYTGSWGSNGKLAVLHEKELVLNKEDTANILAATQIAGSLGRVFDEISKILTGSAISYVNSTNDISKTEITKGQAIDQNVQIEASFPNATDRDEIQEAFNNLVNLAVQKAFEED